MSALDDMTNLIPVVTTAGIVTKITNSMFPGQPQQSAPTRRRKSKKSKRMSHPGNFSNIGL